MTPSPRDWRPFALLLVDAQEGFWPEAIARGFPDFPDRVAELLRVCRAEGIEVVHVRSSFRADMSDWMIRYKLRGRIPCVEGTPGVATLPFALEQAGERVLVKQTYDAFHHPALLPHLRSGGKRFVLVAGLVTSTCVLCTALSATQHGFLAALVDDACADLPSAHAHTLDRYGFALDRVTTADLAIRHNGWLADLRRLDDLARPPSPPYSGCPTTTRAGRSSSPRTV